MAGGGRFVLSFGFGKHGKIIQTDAVAHGLQCSSEGYKRKHMVSQNHGYSICTYLGF